MNKNQIKAELRRWAKEENFHGGMDSDAFSVAQDFINYDDGEGVFESEMQIFFLLVAEAL